jgi:hypothetical protein
MNVSGPIRAIIAADTNANNTLQGRVYPGVFPDQYTLPAVAVNIVSVQPNATKTGPSDVDVAMVQIDCYAASYSTAQNVCELVRTAIDYYRGDVLIAGDTISIDWINYEGQTDVWEEKPKEYRVSCDYTVRVSRGNTIGEYDNEILIPGAPSFVQVYGPYVDDAEAIADGRVVGELYEVAPGNDAIPAGVIKKISAI